MRSSSPPESRNRSSGVHARHAAGDRARVVKRHVTTACEEGEGAEDAPHATMAMWPELSDTARNAPLGLNSMHTTPTLKRDGFTLMDNDESVGEADEDEEGVEGVEEGDVGAAAAARAAAEAAGLSGA
jgi:hypothetical protein